MISLPASSAGSVFCVSHQVLPETVQMRLKPRGGWKKNPRVKDRCFFSRHRGLTAGVGAECQEAKSTWVAKLGQGLKSPFCGGIVGLRNQEGGETTQRMQGKRKTRDCAGSETQKCTQPQLARGSGILRSCCHRERNSPGDGRRCGGETVHGLSGHRSDSHPVWVGEQQPWKSSLEQRVLPRVPVQPEAAGKKVKQKKKLKENCGEED